MVVAMDDAVLADVLKVAGAPSDQVWSPNFILLASKDRCPLS